jgi:hypothetical protein
MVILAHRGLWRNLVERNQECSLTVALKAGFGLETDVRDAAGKLVISHDPPEVAALPFENLLNYYRALPSTAPLAINIKADGLKSRLKPLLQAFEVDNYFCFDMSLPEMLNYRREGLRYFTRQSEHEPQPLLYGSAAGVWMDAFESDWITPASIRSHLEAGKQVALVSPELHRRPHENFWNCLRDAGLAKHSQVMLCTDFPESARAFFYE